MKTIRYTVALVLLAVVGVYAADAVVLGEQAPQKVNWVLLLIPVVTPIVIALLKLLIPKIPKAWLPIIAPIFGALVDLLLSGSLGQGTVIAAICGSAGVGLREIVDQLKKAAAAPTAEEQKQ